MSKNQEEKQPSKPLNAYVKFSSLGIQMAIIIGGGCYGGFKLDEYFKNTNSVFTIILSLLSIALAMYVVLKEIIKSSK
jgi:ATP synthase protein I